MGQRCPGFPVQRGLGFWRKRCPGFPGQRCPGFWRQRCPGFPARGARGFGARGARGFPGRGARGLGARGARGFPARGALGLGARGARGFPARGARCVDRVSAPGVGARIFRMRGLLIFELDGQRVIETSAYMSGPMEWFQYWKKSQPWMHGYISRNWAFAVLITMAMWSVLVEYIGDIFV